jgi:hypothetical protein
MAAYLFDIKWSLELGYSLVNVPLQRGNIYRLAHSSCHIQGSHQS